MVRRLTAVFVAVLLLLVPIAAAAADGSEDIVSEEAVSECSDGVSNTAVLIGFIAVGAFAVILAVTVALLTVTKTAVMVGDEEK